MARKSRKNMMPQAAVQEAVQQNEKELLRTAAYARLSVENGGHETEDSLHTQILQIHNYIRENPEPIPMQTMVLREHVLTDQNLSV